MRERYLHIDGEWRDHVTYALTAEELDAPLADRFEQRFGIPGWARTEHAGQIPALGRSGP